jgi:hypothetical protein
MSYNSPFTGNVIQPTDVSYRAVTLSANTQLNWPINGNATDDYAARIMQVTATTAGLSLYMPPANQASVGQDALIRNVGANTFTVKDFAGTNTIISVAAGESKYVYITANPKRYTLPSASSLGNNWFTLFKNNGTGSMVVSAADNIDGSSTKTFAPSESAFIVCTGTTYVTVGYGVSSQFFYTSLVKAVTAGSYTLTASEASNTIQTYTGTLTGNVTIVYPPVVNLYVIKNSTTAGGYTFTVTTGSGTTVVIPAGQQVTLACDGTNFFNANTSQAGAVTTVTLGDGTVAAPSLTFASELSTGNYRAGAGQFNTAILGVLRSTLSATGLSIVGVGAFTGAVSGTTGTFTGAVSGTTGTFTSGVSGGTF